MKKMAFACGAMALGLVLTGLAERRVAAQQPPAGGEAKPAPASPSRPWPVKLKDGQPDVQGIWNGAAGPCVTTLEPWKGGMAGPDKITPGCIIDPPDGMVPYQPWARARRNEVGINHLTPNAAQVDTLTRGWPAGLPRQNYYHHYQILQPPGAVVILYETHHEFRYISLDGRPYPDSRVKLWLGSSRGRWEGTTLVIETRNVTDRVRMSIVGDFFSDEVKITERWKFVDADTLELSTTVDDPKVFTRPFTVFKKIPREKEQGFELMEYAGVEGERDAALMPAISEKLKDRK